MERLGAELIAFYLSPDRLPLGKQWSHKHAHTQGRLCERFAAPVIAGLVCQDITARQIVNAAPTPGEGTNNEGCMKPGSLILPLSPDRVAFFALVPASARTISSLKAVAADGRSSSGPVGNDR